MVGWHHRLNAHEFEQAPGDGEEQGSLACCSPWGRKGLDTTERLNNSLREMKVYVHTKTCAHLCIAAAATVNSAPYPDDNG